MDIHSKTPSKPPPPTTRIQPSPRPVEFRHATEKSVPSGNNASPDFEKAAISLQRRDLEASVVQVLPPEPVTRRLENGCLVLQPTGGEPYAVALARVRGIGSMVSPQVDRDTPIIGPASRTATGIYEHRTTLLYLLLGDGPNIEVFVGVKAAAPSASTAAKQAVLAFATLRTCLAAHYTDVRLVPFSALKEFDDLQSSLAALGCGVSLLGNPGLAGAASREFSATDSMVRSLAGSRYAYAVHAEPIGAQLVADRLQQYSREIAAAHRHVRWSASVTQSSVGHESREQMDRFAQHYEELLEVARDKADAGLRQGMWRVSATLLTASDPDLRRSGALLRAAFAGPDSKPEPIKVVFHGDAPAVAESVRTFRPPAGEDACSSTLSSPPGMLATDLCSDDLGLLIELPRKEAPGFRVSRPREFALDIETKAGRCVQVGVVQSSAGPTNNQFGIELDDLSRHALVVGVTGSGKTTTAFHLLNQIWCQYRIPFLVIEPAKAQYRHLLKLPAFKDLQIFAPGLGQIAPLRMNPFEFPVRTQPQSHISNLYTVFNAAFILYAPMPYVLERSLYEVYEDRGWDLGLGRHPEADSQTGEVPPLAFPTLTDLYLKIGDVVNRLGYEDRIRMDVTAGLQARVDSLRVGQKGQTFDCRRSVPFDALLQRPTVLELSHVGNDEEKAFLIGLLLMRLYETLELKGDSSTLRHVTLVEEAHRLLTRTSTDTGAESANVKGKSVEAFCNILAEIRSYGEGLIIAEQIPTKLAQDVLKNTNLKIMHRIVASDDREVMAGTMNLTGAQRQAVTSLARGEAAVYSEGLESPVLARVPWLKTPVPSTDEDVRRCSDAFYQKHRPVLQPFSGCAFCPEVCRYGARARRNAGPSAIWVWAYAISALENPKVAADAWNPFTSKLVPPSTVLELSPTERKNMTWCQFTAASDVAFWQLRRRFGLPFNKLTELLGTFTRLGDLARRSRSASDMMAIVSEFTARLNAIMQVPAGPYRGCVKCARRCLYRPLGQTLFNDPSLRKALREAGRGKNWRAAMREVCEQYAARSLFTDRKEVINGLALCFLAHLADDEQVPDPVAYLDAILASDPSPRHLP